MKTRQSKRAVTMTELIVVVGIIATLTAIATPIAVNHASQARVVAAKLDTKNIADAMEECGSVHGFYVPIHLLDNIPPLPVGSTSTAYRDDFDNDLNQSSQVIYLIDPAIPLGDQVNNQRRLIDGQLWPPLNVRVGNLYRNWAGPFIEFQNVFEPTFTGNQNETMFLDYPVDPWGQPYRFFCSFGPIGSNITNILDDDPSVWENNDPFNGQILTTVINNSDDLFDRFAIVSFGPDMELDTYIEYRDKTGDDIYTEFGGNYGINSFKAFR